MFQFLWLSLLMGALVGLIVAKSGRTEHSLSRCILLGLCGAMVLRLIRICGPYHAGAVPSLIEGLLGSALSLWLSSGRKDGDSGAEGQ